MDVTGALALIFFFTTFGVIVGGWILARHRERMAIIEKGIAAEDVKALYQRGAWQVSPLSSLKWGILFIAIGAAVLLGIRLREIYGMEDGIIVALIALFGGLGLLVFYFLTRNKVQPR